MAISKVVLNGITQMDVTSVTATAATIRSTYTALDASGQLVTGTYEGGGGSPTISSLTVSPSTVSQTFNSASVDGYKPVTVNAMPIGTAGTPVAFKGAVSANAINVTPSVTNLAGYIAGSTITGTPVTVSASELVSGTKSITSNGTGIDVTNYASVDVSVGGSAPIITSLSVTPTEEEQVYNSVSITIPNNTSLTKSLRGNTGYVYQLGSLSSLGLIEGGTYYIHGTINTPNITIDDTFSLSWSQEGTMYYCVLPYTTTDTNVANVTLFYYTSTNIVYFAVYYRVSVTSITTSSDITISVNAYVPVTVGAISSTYVGSGIPTKSSANMTANGATVTAPSGYYSSNGTYTISGGAAFTPATTLTTSPTITVNSSGLITATNSYSTSITPTVTAGYVSVGTAGTVSVAGTNTSQLTTIAATTYNTSTATQTISSARYLTGIQTIRGVTTTNLSASNILSGVTIQVGDSANASRIATVTGNVAFITYYTGSGVPSSSLGTNGDIYLQS